MSPLETYLAALDADDFDRAAAIKRGALRAKRRELHELECLAAKERADGNAAKASLHDKDAAVVRAQIDTLEHADGNAWGAPVDGWAA